MVVISQDPSQHTHPNVARESKRRARAAWLCAHFHERPVTPPRAPQLHPAHLVSCLDARCTRPGRVGAHGLRENKWELGGGSATWQSAQKTRAQSRAIEHERPRSKPLLFSRAVRRREPPISAKQRHSRPWQIVSAHDDAGSSKQPQLPLRRSRGHNDARSAGLARPLERGVLIVPSHDARGALQRAQG